MVNLMQHRQQQLGFILIILLVSKSKAKLLVNFNEFSAHLTVKNGLVTLNVNVSPTFLCKVPKKVRIFSPTLIPSTLVSLLVQKKNFLP